MLDEESERYITSNGYIHLTQTETLLLELLIKHKGKPVKYKEIIKQIGCSNVALIVLRLRKKIKDEFEIKNKVGFGYYIE